MICHYNNCPEDVKNQIKQVVDFSKILFGENLIGVYLHGSLVMGCFNPYKSDIDILIVLRKDMTSDKRNAMGKKMLEISNVPSPIEISCVIESEIKNENPPFKFSFHFSEVWRQKFEPLITEVHNDIWIRKDLTDIDLSAHIRILKERGITLYGKDMLQVFPLISDESYINSILADFEDAKEGFTSHPHYYILNTCRVLCFLLNRKVTSKLEGGQWYLESFNDDFTDVVKCALAIYTGENVELDIKQETYQDFIINMTNRINELRG